MALLLRGGTLVDPEQGLEKKADLLIERGVVAALGRLSLRKSWKIVDVSDCIVAPGFVDMHAHLREPGEEEKETIVTACKAAVTGGFTSVVSMPDTRTVNDSRVVTDFILDRARQARLANVFPAGAITKANEGHELAEIGEMFDAGIVAVSDDEHPVQDKQVMRRAMEYSLTFDIPLLTHCQDLHLAAGGCMNEGPVSTELGLRGQSRTAEETDVARDLVLSRLTGARVHICHLSTKESLRWVRLGKREGLPITCEVTPHHLLLSEEEVRSYDTNFKVNPPLRSRADVEALVRGIADGSIDCIATDHAPHTRLEKEVPFAQAASGIVGLETAVPLVWSNFVASGHITIGRAVELFSTNPCRILKLNRGTLREGAVADVTVVDPKRRQRVDARCFASKARNTPFDGWELQGWPVLTVVSGRVVWQAKRVD